jgi:adenosylcobinamide amidohydrolase
MPPFRSGDEDVQAPPFRPGTVNIVVTLPVALSDAALVNAVATATEAKVQALLDAGLDCSGTPTDAVCVAAPEPGPDGGEPFAGPRSPWGARIARAVHTAVLAGARPAQGLS